MAQTKSTNWFARNWGWLTFALSMVGVAVLSMRSYKRRWRPFLTEGMARFIGKEGTGESSHPWFNKTAFLFSSPGGISGLAAGNTIEVRDPSNANAYPTGEMKVLDTWEQKIEGKSSRYWVVVDKDLGVMKEGTHSGELKFISK